LQLLNNKAVIYSTVSDYISFIVNSDNYLNFNNVTKVLITFRISFKTSIPTKRYHYTLEQKNLYQQVKYLYEEKSYSFKKISDQFISKGYKSIRSNKDLLPNYIHSIYKKGKVREKRIDRSFKTIIDNVTIFKLNW